jgi:hypothetical protein
MYIGSFVQTGVGDVWVKNTSYPVTLWTGTEGNHLTPVLDENGSPQIVFAMNILGTFGYKYAAVRYVMLTKIGETYWVLGAEC